MLLKINGPLLMPDGGIEGGKTPSATDGKVVSGIDNNTEDALASDGDDKGQVSLDDIFEEAGGEVSSTPAKDGDNTDVTVKIDKNAPISAEDEEEEVVEDKAAKIPAVKTADKTQATVIKPDGDRLEGETEADKELRLKRDYSTFKPEDVELLKKLPNNIFAHVSKAVKARYAVESRYNETVKELNEIKKNPNRIPDNWYENERAFELTPEYQNISNQYDIAEYASEHWRQQLIAIKNKKQFYGLNYQNGQFIRTGPFDASPENEIGVQQNLMAASNQMSQLQASANQLSTQFKSRHAEINKYYDGPETAALFNKLAPELRPDDEEAEILKNALHPADKGHRLANIAGKLFSVMLKQARVIKSLRETANTTKLNNQDGKAAGPSAKAKKVPVTGGKGGSDDKVIDFDELEEEMTT